MGSTHELSAGRRLPSRIRVFVYDPMPVLAEALALFLATQSDLDTTGVTTVADLMASVAGAALVLLSIHLWGPHVVGMVQRIRELSSARILVVGTDNHPAVVGLALAAGANGYVHKRANPPALLTAVRGVASGETVIVGDGMGPTSESDAFLDRLPLRLTPREHEVISLIARDFSAQQIASTLGVSVRTVHSHLHHAYRKLGVHGRVGAILAVPEQEPGGAVT